MGRLPGEESCLTLVWAVLDLLITHQTNGIQFNQLDRQRLSLDPPFGGGVACVSGRGERGAG
jgi:hypothetical protein